MHLTHASIVILGLFFQEEPLPQRHVQVRLEEDEFDAFTRLAQKAKLSVQQAGRQLIIAATAEDEGDPERMPLQHRTYLKAFAQLLASDDGDLIELVVKPLEFASKRLRQRKDVK
jgi:hypothetical protein